MALSIDALLAVVLFVALLAVIAVEPTSYVPETQPRVVANQLVDDAITAIDSTGHLMELVESGDFSEIESKLQDLLPGNIGFRAEMDQYQSNLDQPGDQCRDEILGQDFATCFPNPATQKFGIGESLPSDKELFHGRKVYVRREPGNCKIAGLQAPVGEKEKIRQSKYSVLNFQAAEICDNGIDDDGDSLTDCEDIEDCETHPACIEMTFTFSSSIEVGGVPVTEVDCDEEAVVTLGIDREANVRVPVDMVFAASKNETMAECAIAAGRAGGTLVEDGETGVIRPDFQRVAAFNFTVTAGATGALDAVLSWAESENCAPNCPEFRLKSPTGILYGAGQAGTTRINDTECSENWVDKTIQSNRAYYYDNRTYLRYLALGSALAETGTWEVWVENTIPTTFDIKVKYIENDHYNESVGGLIESWNEPISKVDIAKVLITEFANRAEWDVSDPDVDKHDKYAYAEIGKPTETPLDEGSFVQQPGLKDAKDIGPPISSQLKNLDMSIEQIPGPAYFFVLMEDDQVNDELVKNPAWADHTKFAIIYGDSSDDSQGTYTKQQVIDDALAEGIYYYTIDFSNDVVLGDPDCQNQDLFDLANQTGGRCYPAYDEDSLAAILDIIAQEIGDRAGIDPDPLETTLTMGFPNDFNQIFLYEIEAGLNPTWDEPTKTLQLSNITIISGLWSTDFKMKIPCDFTNCDTFLGEDKIVEMPPGTGATTMDYEIGGIPQDAVTWPDISVTTVQLLYRDLAIAFLGGSFYGINDVTIEYQVSNQGYMDVDLGQIDPTVYFYIGDDSTVCSTGQAPSPAYDSLTGTVYALYPGPPAGDITATKSTDFTDSGYFCLWLNKDPEISGISECSGNNKVVVQCDIPKTFVYVLDYWAWEK